MEENREIRLNSGAAPATVSVYETSPGHPRWGRRGSRIKREPGNLPMFTLGPSEGRKYGIKSHEVMNYRKSNAPR